MLRRKFGNAQNLAGAGKTKAEPGIALRFLAIGRRSLHFSCKPPLCCSLESAEACFIRSDVLALLRQQTVRDSIQNTVQKIDRLRGRKTAPNLQGLIDHNRERG
jgi:hypothetical protein